MGADGDNLKECLRNEMLFPQKQCFQNRNASMCIRGKKPPANTKKNAKSKSNKSAASNTPTAQTPKQEKAPAEKPNEKLKEKEDKKEANMGENILAKPMDNTPVKEGEAKPKTPLHIKVPPPRVMKAKRPMHEKRDAHDPEYKTLELDISEWESVKIMKRSEIDNKENEGNAPVEKKNVEAVEAAA
ncbi:hypothetical protein RB195_015556 [Necator americanus]|uniref:Uncharacterized protein n=1 Tax=Necator americanus TaxID=51031 RepID=A0ABR1E539_NECAM